MGWYGSDCKHQCLGHCKDSTSCNHVNGSCDGCAAGWAGSLCDKGKYIFFKKSQDSTLQIRWLELCVISYAIEVTDLVLGLVWN